MFNEAKAPESPGFFKTQYEFTRYIRNPETNPKPENIEARRLKIYHELFFNNVEGFMATTFPVIKSILNDDLWLALIRDYFEKHHAKSPLFNEMPREFLHYLESEREPHDTDPIFLLELAHYEWAELAISISDAKEVSCDLDGDLLQQHPVLSSTAWVLHYHFPVHLIKTTFMPEAPAETITSIILYRLQDDNVGFIEINPVTARVLQLIEERPDASGRDVLLQVAEEINHDNPELVIESGLGILSDLHQRGIIPGTQELSPIKIKQ